MPTYREIQEFVRKRHQRTVKTCHIAHVKRDLGYQMRARRTKGRRKYPCPEEFRPWIKEAFKRLIKK
ncbi:MAG TPA: hypothetical protein VNU49_08725 [Opitutaceae bacterium]|nr:hypothetical protein [Opitutaceae bacterium]